MSGRRRLSDDERTLWSDVTQSVSPLPRSRQPTQPPTAPANDTTRTASPRPRAAPMQPAVRAPAPAQIAPLGRRFKQEMARGKRAIDARLDLHGLTQAQAHHALLSFLRAAQARGARVVLVITGKGAPSDDRAGERGVLRRQVPHWLRLPELRALVIGFEAAAIGHGGGGALYVSLRRPRS
jgi:DNA-nicking Smr family endonuclease